VSYAVALGSGIDLGTTLFVRQIEGLADREMQKTSQVCISRTWKAQARRSRSLARLRRRGQPTAGFGWGNPNAV
jgi:hypothetical protein